MNKEFNHTRNIGPSDKVVCIDATPLPNFAPSNREVSEYVFPNGFIEEGEIYCVEQVDDYLPGVLAVSLVGKPAFLHGQEIQWYAGRFRRVESLRQRANCSSESRSEQLIESCLKVVIGEEVKNA